MTLGEKLKDARKKTGLSQEQLAEKLSVSRSAVAKWETDKGLPDIANLKAISELLSVSVDYLLDDGEGKALTELREPIELSQYRKGGKARSAKDACCAAKYPEADCIYALVRQKALSKAEMVLDFIVQPGIFDMADSFANKDAYYLVEQKGRQFFVSVSEDFITSRELPGSITDNKFVIGQYRFKNAYTL